jgi:hypothetical protein
LATVRAGISQINMTTPDMLPSDTILVVNTQGYLRVLYCPFRVLCNTSPGTKSKEVYVWVEAVREHATDLLQYSILGNWQSFQDYEIVIHF